MKSIVTSIAASCLLAALAIAQPPRYTVTDLGAVGNQLNTLDGDQYVITNNGLVSGSAAISSTIVHAVLWYKGRKFDIGAHGLGGPNSAAFGVNEWGQAVGQAESSLPNTEDFCGLIAYGFPSATVCLPFLWQYGVMTPLPTLGGANGAANMINNRGEVVGLAENDNPKDPNCPVFQFKPVIWKNGKIQPLPTYSGEDGVAIDINDNGQVVGISGPCAPFNPLLGYYLVDSHALLWEKDGSVHDLGNLGGPAGTFGGNHACAINNKGQVVGHSDLTGDTTFHAYLWTKETGMKDIGTLEGDFDFASAAVGINDRGQVVGLSLDANFNATAFLWENGKMTDLNTLIPAGSPLFLWEATKINSSGDIVGLALLKSACSGASAGMAWLTNQGACQVVHAFLATLRNERSEDTDRQ